MFYSHLLQPLEFTLFCFIDPLSFPSILHQLPSFFYFFIFTCSCFLPSFISRSFSLFSLSCFCTVVDIYNQSDLLSFSTKVSSAFLMLCSFSCLSCGVFCVSLQLRIALEVSSADELKLFVVGGVEIFLLLLLSLTGLRSDTLSGPGAFTNTKKKLLLCF